MYHDVFGFDAMPLASPLDSAPGTRAAEALEQGLSDRLLGLVLASDLFAARTGSPRQSREGAPIAACWPGATIAASGEALDQDDLDAFLGCLLLALRSPMRGSARFSLRDLARLIRPKARRFDVRRLERSLWRLAACRVNVEEAGGGYALQLRLLDAVLCDRRAGLCAVDVGPRMLAACGDPERIERLIAARAPLADGFARWLAGFLSYGPAALRLDFAALRRVAGLSRQPMAAFRVRAVAALQDFLDLGAIAAIESAGPDRLIVSRPAARGEEPACLLLS
ncbi:MAG: hypothetical protein B193_3450 [Solidesulfovibrio magneticus str. Maddingley MBC34]|uniref:Uncharacterized protein n=1 Tax=Solidesulfovibrio magneticus str. Maddingley MBC34 TaxID=1206767 RepID=K6GLG2_9BACT|nr:MAG: hypothetical protein B193_3450 [Solidesulfovibrio magneticus str. Maddingley MBC34]